VGDSFCHHGDQTVAMESRMAMTTYIYQFIFSHHGWQLLVTIVTNIAMVIHDSMEKYSSWHSDQLLPPPCDKKTLLQKHYKVTKKSDTKAKTNVPNLTKALQ